MTRKGDEMNLTRTIPMLVAALLCAAGCQNQPREGEAAVSRPRGDEFRAEGQPTSVHRFAVVHGAAGARNDATLHPHHFDRGQLNSLGQEKLALMLRDDDACDPLVVFLDVPADGAMASRQESVRVFLRDRGLMDSQIRLQPGPNPATTAPAAPAINAKRLLDSGAPVGINPEPTGSPAAAPRR